jgi:serine/threonine protein kinase
MKMQLPNLGETFDNFRITLDLGAGGMGHVFLAEDLRLGRQVAIKFLFHEKGEITALNLSRFEKEARVLATFNHPNIVNIYSTGHYGEASYIVMEYVEGATIEEMCSAQSLQIDELVEVVRQVLAGLGEAHKKGILHRDIKPANLLVDPQRRVKIVDFGICKDLADEHASLTQEDVILGTISYLAPEVLRFEKPSPASDIFSLGVVFYELVLGKHPFEGASTASRMHRICNEPIRVAPGDLDLLPVGLPEIIEKMTALDSSQRYQSVDEVLKDLENFESVVVPNFSSVEVRSGDLHSDLNEAQGALLLGGYDLDEAERILEGAPPEDDSDPEEMELQVSGIMSGRLQYKPFDDEFDTSRLLAQEKVAAARTAYDQDHKNAVMPDRPVRTKVFRWSGGLTVLKLHRFKFILGAGGLVLLFTVGDYGSRIISEAVQNVGVLQEKLTDLKRGLAPPPSSQNNLSRVPASIQKGKTLRIERVRVDLQSGKETFKIVDQVEIVSTSGDITFAKMKDGETHVQSVLQLPRNPFLPPLRKYAKGKFDIKNQIIASGDEIFPLEVGKTFDVLYNTVTGDDRRQHSKACEVVSQQLIQGTEVFQVDCVTHSSGGEVTTKVFYSPSHDLVLREVRVFMNQGRTYQETRQIIDL